MVIDTSCSVWSASCSGQGACALYDNDDFRVKMISLQLGSKVLAVCLQFVVFIQARKKTDWEVRDYGHAHDNVDVNLAMLDKEDVDNGSSPGGWQPTPIYKGNGISKSNGSL